MLVRIATFLRRQTVLCIAFLLAALSCLFATSFTQVIAAIDLRVLLLLFCLMCVIEGWSQAHLLQRFAAILLARIHRLRGLAAIIVGLCFFGSMLLTNDVALITFVPLAISLAIMTGTQKELPLLLVLQTLAANIGSSLTPVGNPQNLYLYSKYMISPSAFFTATGPIVVSGGILLLLCLWLVPNKPFSLPKQDCAPVQVFCAVLYSLLFLLTLLVVFHVISIYIALVCILAGTLINAPSVFKKVDYCLLLTFVCFFVFVANIGQIPAFRTFLETMLKGREVVIGAIFSQFMSNVPSAVLLSGFTSDGISLLKGVNIGGCGTLIASLASLITYQIYMREKTSDKKIYMVLFTLFNFAFLLILLCVGVYL